MFRLFLGLILVLFSAHSWAVPENKAANRQQQSTQDKRGTSELPLSIKVISTDKTPEQAKQEEADRTEKRAIEQQTINLTEQIKDFTGALVLVGIVQAFIFVLQLIVFGKQATRLRETVATAEDSADIARKSVDLARDEFNATHRPKLIVRRIAPIEHEDNGYPIGVRYAVHNVGDGVATIVAMSEKIWLPGDSINLPAIPPYDIAIEQSIMLESGDWREFRCITPVDDREELAFRFGFGEAKSPINPATDADILFLGYIDYVDRLGRKRQTAFLRLFDCKVKRFNPINHHEYEYQD